MDSLLAKKLVIPESKLPISIRPATLSDIPEIDRLQKMQSKALGFMYEETLRGKVANSEVLVAEMNSPQRHRGTENEENADKNGIDSSSVSPCLRGQFVGYIIATDRYLKRDELGVIYQMNIDPNYQRSYIASALLKAQFEKSEYGCKLYCCWCAKDLTHANAFWENMGFVPLAFRAGSLRQGSGQAIKGRTHIFWMKRIRAGDVTTPFWYPSKTDSGAIKDDRVVLPIPPGVHWSEVEIPEKLKQMMQASLPAPVKTKKKLVAKKNNVMKNGLWFNIPQPGEKLLAVREKSATKKVRIKLDPRIKSAARELRDRWMEEVNDNGYLLESAGKYDLVRRLDSKGVGKTVGRRVVPRLAA